MANDTRSSRKIKDDESNTSKKKHVNGKGSSTSGSATTDTSGLRRSARETSSRKQMISSPSSMRKSERLEKRRPSMPLVKKISERIDKQRMPSPLRRSDRGKKHPLLSSSGSKNSEKGSGSSDMKGKKLKREKSVKQLALGARDVSRNEKQDLKPVGMKKKKMDLRTYKALFKPQRRRNALQDIDDELERRDKLSQADSSNGRGSVSKQVEDGEDGDDECSGMVVVEVREDVERTSEGALERSSSSLRNLGEVELSYSSRKHSCTEEPIDLSNGDGLNASKSGGTVKETLDDAQRVQADCSPMEKFQTLELLGSTSIGRSRDHDIDLGTGDSVRPSKRKRYVVDMDSDTSATVANKDICASIVDATSSPSSGCKRQNFVETCVASSKRRRCCDGKGCNRSYHLSCLDPPLDDVPLGVWHCLLCVKKKIESGVHSVSEGIESIWDGREVELSDAEGLRRQKQYFVKYKGLAHIHNHWVPESQLHLEAPSLVAKFDQKNQVTRWKLEWTVPQRLLKKRLIMSPMQSNGNHSGHAADSSDCYYEWLIKWCGLDYEHATWELENASFLHSPHGQSLVREYENRCENAKRNVSFSRVDKSKKEYSLKLSKLPAEVSPGLDYNHLNSVNKLREYWHKGQHAVVIDDQDRVMKVILFILSLLPDVCQPFLIISTSNALSLWEAGFLHLAPSIEVVVYSGNKDTRRSIRMLEFYEEGGCIMFQVLLSSQDAVVEDLEMLKCLRWEAIIVDECQSSIISTHFGQIKMLATGIRLLIFNDQIKESIAEHLNLLSLLDSLGDLDTNDGSKTESNDNLAKLKKRLSQFIAYDCKADFSRFVEYWVPVQISNVQLEQYCATLLSNSLTLCSTSKNDLVGALRDILISTRKCCDHPYIVDPSLQGLITKGLPEVEYLDVGIKASGKLQLLDMMLSEIKNRQLRVVILFQSIGGSGRDSIGDILDDFLRQRFGPDSYERVDGGVLPSKKQAALNKFNNKDSGRFVFLLENRACLPSIRLSSVDTIVIFDSDWNPANDSRVLHRISADSQFGQIKIFRLYSAWTVEEKVLVLAKHNLTVDSNLQGISRSISHMLLMWCTSYLFGRLDEFHGGNTEASSTNISYEQSLLKDVVKEFLALLSENAENNDTSTSIIKVRQSGGTYSTSVSLLGEPKNQLTEGEEPHLFWTKLLEGRNPRWKYSSGPAQRNRKRVQYFDESPKKLEVENSEVGKKRKKVANDSIDLASLKPGLEEGGVAGGKGAASKVPANNGSQSLPRSTACVTVTHSRNHASTSTLLPEVHMLESEERRTLRDAQKSLRLLLKPEISKLCEILQLSEDVKVMVGRFLDYVIDNHHVSREPATILQAFQISLCWIAASLLKHKIDRKESLALAKQHLNFGCKEEEANNVYSKLRLLKKMFLYRTENIKESDSLKDSVSPAEDITKEMLDARMSQSVASTQQNVRLEVEKRSHNQEFADEQILSEQGQAPKYKMTQKEISKSIRRIQKKCEKRMTKLLRKQQEEILEFHRILEEERVQLEKEHRLESALVRSIHSHIPVRIDKLKILDNDFSKKLEEHEHQKDICLKDLEAKQLAEKNEERQKAACWLAGLKSMVQGEFSGGLPSHGSEYKDKVGCSQASENTSHNGPQNVAPVSGRLLEEQSPDGDVYGMQATGAASDVSETVPNEAAGCSVPIESVTLPLNPNCENAVNPIALERVSSAGFEKPNRLGSFSDGPENIVLVNPPPEEQIPDGAPSSVRDQEVLSEIPETAPNEAEGDAGSVEILTPAVESNRENVRRDGSNILNATGNQNDAATSSIDSDSLSVELSLVKSPSVQPVFAPVHSGQLPQNQALEDEGSQLSSSTGTRDAPASGNENIVQQVEVQPLHLVIAGPTDQTNHEAPIIETVEQLQPSPTTNLPFGHNQHVLLPIHEVDHQPCSEGHTSFKNAEAPPQLVEDTSEFSNQAVSHEADIASHLLIDATDLPLGLNQPDLSSASRVDHQPSSEGCASFQNTEAPPQLVEDTAELPSQAVLQPGGNLELQPLIDPPLGGFGTHLPMHTSPQVASRLPKLPFYADPLQNELERLRKETEQAVKVHEDMKLRLRSECDKEIEEITTQIRRKYDAKLQDAEAAFLLKNMELDANHNKVLMNKILAEAFKSKCLDLRPSGSLGAQQVVPSSFMPQLRQLSSSHPTQRPSSITGSSSIGPPAATQPHVQVVHHSSALFPSIAPPLISPMTPSTANPQLIGGIRAPAPHIQPFRPSTSIMSTTSSIPSLLPHGMPTHMPSTSLSVPQLPPRPPLPPSSPPPTYHSRPEITGGFPALHHNSSLSALELLMEVDNRPGPHPPNVLPPPPDLGSNFDSELGALRSSTSIGVNLAHSRVANSGVATDVVCLSDDD
uniref:Putative helicase protein MOM1 isoform X1 n=1 Tax=Davidia involucrata TaxID=16924 RepID=A0A5B7AM86_DAVIN